MGGSLLSLRIKLMHLDSWNTGNKISISGFISLENKRKWYIKPKQEFLFL